MNQFSITLKFFRTNNALEFIQSDLQTYCASLGVLHQTTCLCTFQQNDVVDRKRRHILVVTCTIMLQTSVRYSYNLFIL